MSVLLVQLGTDPAILKGGHFKRNYAQKLASCACPLTQIYHYQAYSYPKEVKDRGKGYIHTNLLRYQYLFSW